MGKHESELSFSICIPVYKGSHLIRTALESILKQGFSNYEIIIGDDNPHTHREESEKTKKIIDSFKDKRIVYFHNESNLGYPRNLKKIVSKAKNDVLFLMAQDDILAKDALQKTHDAFFLADDIGAVTRPYFWFEDDIKKPVRAVTPPDPNHDTILSLHDDPEKAIIYIFGSVGQLSGLAYMRKYLTVPFHEDVFPAHIYPFAGIVRDHKCVFLKDYTVAIGIKDSQTRHVSSIYDKSPTESWVEMFQTVYSKPAYHRIRDLGVKHIVTHYTGLVQIKNYAPAKALMREIFILLKYHWQSIFQPKFWFYVLLTLLVPRSILIPLTDNFKRRVLSKSLIDIRFEI